MIKKNLAVINNIVHNPTKPIYLRIHMANIITYGLADLLQ